EDALRRALARLPCCTTNKDGNDNGDPLNLVLIGRQQRHLPCAYSPSVGRNGGDVVWLIVAYRECVPPGLALPPLADQSALPVRQVSRHSRPEGSRDDPPTQSHAGVADSDPLPWHPGMDRADH